MAAPMKKTVELFYDVISPYTWFAFEVLCRYQTRWNIELKLKPFFLGGIMNATGNQPPMMIANKAAYMQGDLSRLSKYFEVPMTQPQDIADVLLVKGSLSAQRFLTASLMSDRSETERLSRELWMRVWSRRFQEYMQTGTLSAARFLTSVDMTCPEFTEKVSRELWMRIWARDEDISKPESFIQAGKMAGMSDEQVQKTVAMIKDQAVKDRLKKHTEEALSYGSFGSPTIIAHVDEPVMLFGSDRFPILAQVLGEKWDGPVPGSSKL